MGGLRVLLIGPYPREAGNIVGGVESVVSTLAPALAMDDQIELVTVLSFERGMSTAQFRENHGKLHVWHLRGQERLSLPTRAFLEVIRASRVAAEVKPDIVHGQGIGINGHIATHLGLPSIVTIHGILQHETRIRSKGRLIDSMRTRLVEAMSRRVLERAGIVISISAYDFRTLIGKGLQPQKVVHVPNPVAPEFFEVLPSRQECQIFFGGSIIPIKNIIGLIRGFARVRDQLPNARLVIAGPSPDNLYHLEIEQLINELYLDEHVLMLGHINFEGMLREFKRARIVVLFSYLENLPTVIAQAMAAGKPVVASRIGGLTDLIFEGENGYLIDAGDEGMLADRLITLLESPTLCSQMGNRGREIARQKFNVSEIVHQTIDAYRLAIAL